MLPSRAPAAAPRYPLATGATDRPWFIRPFDPNNPKRIDVDGFESTPPGLFVPTGGQRALLINVLGQEPLLVANAAEFLGSASPCWVVLSGNFLTIIGRRPGRVSIELQKGDATKSIDVTIKNERKIPIVAHFVEHGPTRKTRMTRATLDELIAAADGLLRPKANVRVVLLDARSLPYDLVRTAPDGTVGRGLGRTVRTGDDARRDEWNMVARHAVPASDMRHLAEKRSVSAADLRHLLNLFLVRRFEDDDKDERDDSGRSRQPREAAATDKAGNCVLEDRFKAGGLERGAVGKTLAHEICHHLGLDHVADETALMYRSQPHGDLLSLREAHRINPSGFGLEF
jgi:hypothetical protein